MSNPLDATSVAINIGIILFLNCVREFILSFWLLSPCIEHTFYDLFFRYDSKNFASFLYNTNIIILFLSDLYYFFNKFNNL